MSRWRIDPAQARAIVNQAEQDAAGIDTALKTMEHAIVNAMNAVKPGTKAALAVQDLGIDPVGVDAIAAQNQVETAIRQTRAALSAYAGGDEAMAANANRHVTDVQWGGE
ncbi:DUF6507 family protein [Curtobacterium sp. SP.BCo]|uniref:DUF6507 family protein n=1 Tax=Curtobacterium sp. SP.BCo TaxID=3435229 RepID=UPI003F73B5F6